MKKISILIVIVTSMLPMLITVFVVARFMDIAYSVFEGKKILFAIKCICFILDWSFSLAWLWFTLKIINTFKQDKRVYFLLLLFPIAFWHNIFMTFFLIYYSMVPFAP